MADRVAPTLLALALTCCTVAAPREAVPGPLTIRLARPLQNPRADGRGGGNSYVLHGMPADAPNVAASFATGYGDCTVGFYDADLKLIGSWRDPVADGDMVMCVTAGDLDGDGRSEIVLTTRQGASGAHALRWNAEAREIETVWSFLDTPTVRTEAFFRGIAVGNFTEGASRRYGHPRARSSS